MIKFNSEDMEEILINYVGVHEEALILAIKLLGTRREVYEDILFVYTGYKDFEQFMEEEGNRI